MNDNERLMMEQQEHIRKTQQARKDEIAAYRKRILSDLKDAVKQSAADAAFDVARLLTAFFLVIILLTTLSLA